MDKNINKDVDTEIIVDLNRIPPEVGQINIDPFHRKMLKITDIEKLLSWVRGKFPNKNQNFSVCITGPMSNLIAVQLGAYIARNTAGDIFYSVEFGTRYKLILNGRKEAAT
jgi:hypothetical protein